MRFKQYWVRTEDACWNWMRQFILFREWVGPTRWHFFEESHINVSIGASF